MASTPNTSVTGSLGRPALGKESYTKTSLTPSTKYGKTPYQVNQERAEASIASAYEKGTLTEKEKQQYGLDKGNVTVQDGKLFVTVSKQGNPNEQDLQEPMRVPVTPTTQNRYDPFNFAGQIRGEPATTPKVYTTSTSTNIPVQRQSAILESAKVSTTEKINYDPYNFVGQIRSGTEPTSKFNKEIKTAAATLSPYKFASDIYRFETAKVTNLVDIKSNLQAGDSKAKFVSYFIPTTPFEIQSMIAIPYIYTKLPAIGRIGLSGVFAYSGGKTALDITKPYEERLAGGLIGGLGVLGFAQESLPYIKGQAYKLFPDYKPVKTFTTPEGTTYKAIKITDGEKVALIPIGDTSTGSKSAFKSTAYGFTRAEQSKYIDTTPISYSSAKGLFNWYKGKTKVSQDFFATPQDLITGTPQTRTSRLGSGDTDLFSFPKSSGGDITFRGGSEQIVRFKTLVTAKEQAGTFEVGPSRKAATELEVFKRAGKTNDIIKWTETIGRTTINGKGVKIYSAEIIAGKPIKSKLLEYPFKTSATSYSPIDYYISPVGISAGVGITPVFWSKEISSSGKTISSPYSPFMTSGTSLTSPLPSTPSFPTRSYPQPISISYPQISLPSPTPSYPSTSIPSSPSTSIFTSPSIISPTTISFGYESPPFKGLSFSKSKSKSKRQRISPSLLGIASRDLLGITGTKPFKDIYIGGINPFETRFVLTKGKKKKSSGKKRK